jgi:SAM-dependent methyltransferase
MTSGSKCESFGRTYTSIFDALYRDKDYAAESRFVMDQLKTALLHTPRHILDLGCGTGLHALQMAQVGISVTGVDRSASMIGMAKKHREALSHDARELLHFRIGDIRSIDCHCRYDAVVSLFHVMSYLTEKDDLEATFQVARRHLVSGGAFLFDFWYGPAILRDPPKKRVKIAEIGDTCVRRTSLPKWDAKRQMVCVNFDIEIKNIASGEIVREREQHHVRYFFLDELESCLVSCGFEVIRFGEALIGGPPSDTTFSAYALARAQ